MHDYTFTLFEEELKSQQKVVEYDSTSLEASFSSLVPGLFIKVKGPAIFNDVKAICDMIAKFNQFGEAITYVTTHGERTAAQELADQKLNEEKDRNRRAKVKTALKGFSDIRRLAKESGLHHDQDFLKNLGYLLDYGYEGHFELQICPYEQQSCRPFFSALLKRDCLREDAPLLVKKYSRRAQGEFCLLGLVCQCPGVKEVDRTEDAEPQHLREALGRMVSALTTIEKGFFGRLENEIILDPLAVYREV